MIKLVFGAFALWLLFGDYIKKWYMLKTCKHYRTRVVYIKTIKCKECIDCGKAYEIDT